MPQPRKFLTRDRKAPGKIGVRRVDVDGERADYDITSNNEVHRRQYPRAPPSPATSITPITSDSNGPESELPPLTNQTTSTGDKSSIMNSTASNGPSGNGMDGTASNATSPREGAVTTPPTSVKGSEPDMSISRPTSQRGLHSRHQRTEAVLAGIGDQFPTSHPSRPSSAHDALGQQQLYTRMKFEELRENLEETSNVWQGEANDFSVAGTHQSHESPPDQHNSSENGIDESSPPVCCSTSCIVEEVRADEETCKDRLFESSLGLREAEERRTSSQQKHLVGHNRRSRRDCQAYVESVTDEEAGERAMSSGKKRLPGPRKRPYHESSLSRYQAYVESVVDEDRS